MTIQNLRFSLATAVLLLATLFASSFAHAQVSGGGDAPKMASLQPTAMPQIADLAGDPAWQVDESDLSGIRYVRSRNITNGLRVVAAKASTSEWVIQTDALPPVVGRTLYRDDKEEVVLYRQHDQDLWIVLPAEQP